jgi:hypothetical protein
MAEDLIPPYMKNKNTKFPAKNTAKPIQICYIL